MIRNKGPTSEINTLMYAVMCTMSETRQVLTIMLYLARETLHVIIADPLVILVGVRSLVFRMKHPCASRLKEHLAYLRTHEYYTVAKNVSSYTVNYPSNALYTSAPGGPVHSDTKSNYLVSIRPRCNYYAKTI